MPVVSEVRLVKQVIKTVDLSMVKGRFATVRRLWHLRYLTHGGRAHSTTTWSVPKGFHIAASAWKQMVPRRQDTLEEVGGNRAKQGVGLGGSDVLVEKLADMFFACLKQARAASHLSRPANSTKEANGCLGVLTFWQVICR